MATDSGYSNQKKKGLAQYETVHDLGSGSFGKVAANKALFELLPSAPIVSVSDILGNDGQVKYWNIELTGHTASAGNILRFDAGSLLNFYFEIIQVVDVDNFYVLPISDIKPTAAMTAAIMGWVTQKMSQDGEVSVSITSTPTSYEYDGLPQTVIQDTADTSNNRALPNLQFIYKDGVQVPITKDTGNPSSTIGLPVEIVAASGTPINITAGDINIQTTDIGGSFDSMRIGDGSGNYIGVNANKEALVHDAEVKAELVTLNTVDFATSALQTEISGKLDTMSLDLSEAAQDLMLMQPDIANSLTALGNILTAIGVTNAKDFATQTTLAAVLTAIGATNAKDFATQTTLAALEAKFGTLGQKASAGSAPVVLSTAQEAILASLDTKLSTLIASNAVRTLDSVVNVAATTANSPAPAGAKGFIIQNSANSNGGVRFTKQGGGASATVGFYLGVGQSTSYIDGAANLALFDVDATGFNAAIIWFT